MRRCSRPRKPCRRTKNRGPAFRSTPTARSRTEWPGQCPRRDEPRRNFLRRRRQRVQREAGMDGAQPTAAAAPSRRAWRACRAGDDQRGQARANCIDHRCGQRPLCSSPACRSSSARRGAGTHPVVSTLPATRMGEKPTRSSSKRMASDNVVYIAQPRRGEVHQVRRTEERDGRRRSAARRRQRPPGERAMVVPERGRRHHRVDHAPETAAFWTFRDMTRRRNCGSCRTDIWSCRRSRPSRRGRTPWRRLNSWTASWSNSRSSPRSTARWAYRR